MNHYKLVYCLLQKIYGQPLKKITYLPTRPRFLAQGQGLEWQGKSQNFWPSDQGLTSLIFV